jgi:hypothetical protein
VGKFQLPRQATSSSVGVILNGQVCDCEKTSRLPFSRLGMRDVVMVLSTLSLQLCRSCSVDSLDTPVSLPACVRKIHRSICWLTTGFIIVIAASVDPPKAMFIYRQRCSPCKYNQNPPTPDLPSSLYPLISLTHSHPLPPMTSFHRVTLPSAQATAKTFPARLHETLHTASGKSGSGLSDP